MKNLYAKVREIDNELDKLSQKRKKLTEQKINLYKTIREAKHLKKDLQRVKNFLKGKKLFEQKVLPHIINYHIKESPKLTTTEYAKLFNDIILTYHIYCTHNNSDVRLEQIIENRNPIHNTNEEDVSDKISQTDKNIVQAMCDIQCPYEILPTESDKEHFYVYCFECKQLRALYTYK